LAGASAGARPRSADEGIRRLPARAGDCEQRYGSIASTGRWTHVSDDCSRGQCRGGTGAGCAVAGGAGSGGDQRHVRLRAFSGARSMPTVCRPGRYCAGATYWRSSSFLPASASPGCALALRSDKAPGASPSSASASGRCRPSTGTGFALGSRPADLPVAALGGRVIAHPASGSFDPDKLI
jgi:hypothetical protein